MGLAVTVLPVDELKVASPLQAYVEALLPVNVVVPPLGTVEGEAEAVTLGKAFTVNSNTLEYASIL